MKTIRHQLTHIVNLSCILLLSSLIVGCKDNKLAEKPAQIIKVAEVVLQNVSRKDVYTGHLESPGAVYISSRVTGVISKTTFKEGSIVNKGDLLVTIDERPFLAEAAAKNALVTQAQAQFKQIELQFKRSESLHKMKAISVLEYDQAHSSYVQAKAEIAAAKAESDIANLNVEWSKITAPISGRVGQRIVTEGNIVKAEDTILTVLTSIDPLYTYVDIPENVFLEYTSIDSSTDLQSLKIPCSIGLENEKGFPHVGHVDFINNQINSATGTMRVRCVLENKSGTLIPGFFAKMQVAAMPEREMVVVPDNTILTDQSNRYVLVVNDQNTIEYRTVVLGYLASKNLRVITSGLKEGEKIVIEGTQFAKPGTKITPEMHSYSDKSEVKGE